MPVLPEPPVDVQVDTTITSIELNELVESHQEVDKAHDYCSNSSNAGESTVTMSWGSGKVTVSQSEQAR